MNLVLQAEENQDEEGLARAIVDALFEPFQRLGRALVNQLAELLATTPTLYPNPAVEEIFWLNMWVAVLFAGLIVTAAGFFLITGDSLGIPYRQARKILPRLILVLPLSVAALPLLQLGVDLSNTLVEVFQPDDLAMQLTEMAGLGTSLVLIWFINAWLLLTVVVIFLLRNVYLLFIGSMAPLLAVFWTFPTTKRYADTFISGWFTALAMAPLCLLALRFNLALLEAGGTGLQPVSNWVLGIASFTLLIWLPKQLYGASQAAVGRAHSITQGFKTSSPRGSDDGDRGGGDGGGGPDYDDWRNRRRGGRR